MSHSARLDRREPAVDRSTRREVRPRAAGRPAPPHARQGGVTMLTVYFVSFLLGLGLSVVSFVSGLDRVHVFGHGHHGSHHHHGPRRVMSPFNAAAITAFLAWFGGDRKSV